MRSSTVSSSTQKTIRDVCITRVLAIDESEGKGDHISINNNTVDVLAPTKDIRRRFKFDYVSVLPDLKYCVHAAELIQLNQSVVFIAFGDLLGRSRIEPLVRHFKSQLSFPLRVSVTRVHPDRIESFETAETERRSTRRSSQTTACELSTCDSIEEWLGPQGYREFHLIVTFETLQGAKVTFVEVSSAQPNQLSPSKQEIFVNTSLSTLVNVLRQINEEKKHISFRDSKLTMALQKPIQECSEIYFVAFITSSSSHTKETLSTLGYVQSLCDEPYNTVAVVTPERENIRETFHSLEEKIKFWRQRASSVQAESQLKTLSLSGPHSAPASPLALRSKPSSDEVDCLRAQVIYLRARLKLYELRAAKQKKQRAKTKAFVYIAILCLVLWLLLSPI
ncbi:hypothetical protein B9G98_00100 [Wickerhamiella sorbophila]|uniref:Kinesin motor domain-containing protein n=1 Tax=Wickerhamiella sorbophila TaxID=45607 RepID=A0A2T0FBY8_9ASCO|nr:hypothetical protein B9G98_00100 [Wickerhamiella sorbophila]PRT52480.1 hypothetical protein B9G98_00100 [Wickerhamiella sorbophila]